MSINDYLLLCLDKSVIIDNGIHSLCHHSTLDTNLESFKIVQPLQLDQEEWVPIELVPAYRTNSSNIIYKINSCRCPYKTIISNLKFFVCNSMDGYVKVTINNNTFYLGYGVILNENGKPLIRMYAKVKRVSELRTKIVDIIMKVDYSVYTVKSKINDTILKTILPVLAYKKWDISICDLEEDIWDHPVIPNDPDNANRDIYEIFNDYFNNQNEED